MAIQMSRAPRTALGRDQHDIAGKRLKVDSPLAATTRFARKAVTLHSQLRNQGKPCPALTAPRHPKRKITGTAQPLQQKPSESLEAAQINRAPRAALALTKNATNRKRPTINSRLFQNFGIAMRL
jgi:hypothetical protein